MGDLSAKNSGRIIRAAERRRRVPFSDMHIWRLERAGKFPKRIKLGDRRVGWDLDEVIAWIETRKALRDVEP
jgi:prophage regulatory protein